MAYQMTFYASNSIDKIRAAIEAKTVQYPAYVFLRAEDGSANGRLAFVDQGNVLKFITGEESKKQVVSLDALPEVSAGDKEVLYVVDGIVYTFDGEKYRSQYVDHTKELEALDERLTGVESSLEEIADDIAELEEKTSQVYEKIRYEVTSAPEGTLVDYREKEIRVMCPKDTKWVKQNVGVNGLPNRYYITFKAYAPEEAVSFKEDIKPTIEDQTMWYFENNSSAGIDKYGRKYSTIWWSVAEYDEETDTWTYFGAESTVNNMVGRDYSVEWYDANGVVIESDYIRIYFTNEDCHSTIEPSYVGNITTEINTLKEILEELKTETGLTFIELG